MKQTCRRFPLSFAQQRLWFLDRFQPNTSTYNNANTVSLRGPLCIQRLHAALEKVVARHDSLRMRFVDEEGEPLAEVTENVSVHLRVVDLQSLHPAAREDQANNLARDEARRPFVLSEGPMARFSLIRLSPTHHLLVYVVHHIISDRWSLGIWLKELGAFYDDGQDAEELPVLEINYGSYAAQQKQDMDGSTLETRLKYWRKQLGERPPVLDLPLDHQRPSIQSFEGAKYTFHIEPTQTEDIRALALRCRASLFMTTMSAFFALLGRYTHQSQLIMGTFVAGRKQVAVEPLIGFFVNTIALRSDLSGNPGFLQMVKGVRKALFSSHKHQDLPFEKLVEEMVPTRDMSRSPLVQVAFNFHNVPMPDKGFEGLETALGEVDMGVSRLDLTLTMRDLGDKLEFCFEYNTGLFLPQRIQRMAQHFKTLLGSVTANEETRLWDLPLLPDAERERLVHTLNDTVDPVPEFNSIFDFFEQRALAHPDAIAVQCEDQELTYAELLVQCEARASQLANLGVGPGSRVGILLNRSLHMPIALLATLRSGSAYIPLDPAYPEERLNFIVQDASLDVMMTESGLTHRLAVGQAQKVHMDEPVPKMGTKPLKQSLAHHTAYLIYTSGTTGTPKGVMVTHANALNLLGAFAREPGMSRDDVLVSVTTLSFDISVLELFLPLTTGAKVVIATQDQTRDMKALSRLIQSSGATLIQATPATWKLMLDYGWEGAQNLGIFCGGEAMPRDMANSLLAQGARLYNFYGPTETTVWSSKDLVTLGSGPVPLGGPIANTSFFVRDRFGGLAPTGIPGELQIGGKGVTQGYHCRPALTAERFIPDPYSGEPGSRLYRTGDLVKRQEGEGFHFLGRVDHQVKLRGFRIELEEVETVLGIHPEVARCVAIADGDTGEQRLLAYVVGHDSAPDPEHLRTYMAEQLPDYMVPSLFINLDVMPLTPNGKIDRSALPAPEQVAGDTTQEIVAPRNDFEIRLLHLFQAVLKRKDFGVEHSFFKLGGHSLMAVRLLHKIEQSFGKSLDLPVLFQRRTVAALAELLQSEGPAPTRSAMVPLKEGGALPPLFCIRGIFIYQALADRLDAEQPVYGIYLESEVQALKKGVAASSSVAEMAALYVAEIRKVRPHGPYYLIGISFGGILGVEIGRILLDMGEKVEWVFLLDAALPGAVRKNKLRWVGHHLERVVSHGPGYIRKRLKERKKQNKAQAKGDKHSEKMLANRGSVYREAIKDYTPTPYSGDLSLFLAANERDSEGYSVDPSLGWNAVAQAELTIQSLPGAHLDLLVEPNVDELAKSIRAQLSASHQKNQETNPALLPTT